MSLASGVSRLGVSRITMHTWTAIMVTRKFLEDIDFRVEGDVGEPGVLCVRGIGL